MPSAFTRGDSIEETVANIKEAIELALATTMTVPIPTSFKDVKLNDGCVQLVTVSLADYLRKNSKTVQCTVSVPDYLAALAKQDGINVSQVLKNALESRYVHG